MFVPYANLEIALNETDNVVSFTLPWIKIEAEAVPSTVSTIRKLVQDFPGNYKTPEFQEFFSTLKGLSVGYLAPRPMFDGQLSVHTKINYSSEQLGQELQREFPQMSHIRPMDEVTLDQLLEHSSTGSNFDPISLFGLLKEYGMQAMANLDQTIPVYELLEQQRVADESAFFQTIEVVLNQTYFITSSFETIIAGGIESSQQPYLRDFLTDLLKEEKGHNNLIKHSIIASGGQVKPTAVFDSSKLLMFLLKKAIDNSPLALALFMDILEGDGYPESDPMADLLARSTRPDAAKGIEQHFRINLEGNHKDTGIHLAEKIPMLKKHDVELASFIFKAAIAAVELTDKHIGQMVLNNNRKG